MEPSGGQANSLSAELHALKSPYRRQLLIALLEENPQDDDDCDPLAIVSAGGEPDVSEVELVHMHLPLLEEQRYIEWDRDTQTIQQGPKWDEIGPVIELLYEHRDEYPQALGLR